MVIERIYTFPLLCLLAVVLYAGNGADNAKDHSNATRQEGESSSGESGGKYSLQGRCSVPTRCVTFPSYYAFFRSFHVPIDMQRTARSESVPILHIGKRNLVLALCGHILRETLRYGIAE